MALHARVWRTNLSNARTEYLPCPKAGGSNFSHWLEHYQRFVDAVPMSKLGVAMNFRHCDHRLMQSSTERGTWNCEPAGIAKRLHQMLSDGVSELAIFSLAEDAPCNLDLQSPSCGCSNLWFQAAKAFMKAADENGAAPPTLVPAAAMAPFNDSFARVDGALGNGWVEGWAATNNYSKLGIFNNAVTVVDPTIRKGKYPPPGNNSAMGGCPQFISGRDLPGYRLHVARDRCDSSYRQHPLVRAVVVPPPQRGRTAASRHARYAELRHWHLAVRSVRQAGALHWYDW